MHSRFCRNAIASTNDIQYDSATVEQTKQDAAAPKKIPVTVLTGFLGSGKTTLLNRILTENHGQRIAVIENEFGEIGVDQDLVINADEEIFEMNNGCICCTVRGDLIRVLGNLMKRRDKFDRILVETTGLADPGPVAQTFFMDEDIQRDFALDGIVTLVDAKHLLLHLDEANEAREQIAFADVIVLNKLDLVTDEEANAIEIRVRSMNALARVHRARMAEVPVAAVLDVGGFDLDRALDHKPTFLEPEYPFEWAGIFQTNGDLELEMDDGPDPTMTILAAPVASADAPSLAKAAEQAFKLFSRNNERTLNPGETMVVGEGQYILSLQGPANSKKVFKLSCPVKGALVAVFTQHLPIEFSMRVMQNAQALAPIIEKEYAAGHSHDDTVTSVGLSSERDLVPERFQPWLSGILRTQGKDIFRMKGIVAMAGDDRRYVFQAVHMLMDGQPDRLWGKTIRSSQIVFIGRNLDREQLTKGFNSCLA